VDQRHLRLPGRERPGQRRVGVPVDEHRIGRQLGDRPLERCQHARSLGAVRAAAQPQLALGPGQAKLAEEDP